MVDRYSYQHDGIIVTHSRNVSTTTTWVKGFSLACFFFPMMVWLVYYSADGTNKADAARMETNASSSFFLILLSVEENPCPSCHLFCCFTTLLTCIWSAACHLSLSPFIFSFFFILFVMGRQYRSKVLLTTDLKVKCSTTIDVLPPLLSKLKQCVKNMSIDGIYLSQIIC